MGYYPYIRYCRDCRTKYHAAFVSVTMTDGPIDCPECGSLNTCAERDILEWGVDNPK